MRSARSTLVVLVAPAGVLAGHALGYVLAGVGGPGSHAVDHHYLPLAVSVTVPMVVGALLWMARPGRAGHRGPRDQVPLGLLLATQWTLFVGQELVEHAAAGDPVGLLHSRALWFGLGAQVTVAAAGALLLSTAARVGSGCESLLVPGPSRPAPPVLPLRPGTGECRPAIAVLRSSTTSRGPPLRPC